MGNQGSLFLTGMSFSPCPFAFGDVREPGCSSTARFTPEMLCKLGAFPPLMFSLQGALLKITCWLLFLGGRTPRKTDAFWLYRLHSDFTLRDEDGWLPAGFKLVPSVHAVGDSTNTLLRRAEFWVSLGRHGYRMLR